MSAARDVRPGAVPGNNEKLLVRIFPVEGYDVLAPFVLRFRAPFLALYKADSAVQPIRKRIVEGNLDQPVGLVSFPYFFTQQVERVGVAVMRRDDHDFAAPHEERQRRLHDLAELIMESRLVEDDHALTPAKRTRAGRERHDLIAGSENDAVGEDVVRGAVGLRILEQAFFDFTGGLGERLRPHGRRIDELAGHVEAVPEIERIHPSGGTRRSGKKHGGGGDAPRQTDAAALFDDHHRKLHNRGHGPLLVRQKDVGKRLSLERIGQRLPGGFAVAFPLGMGNGRVRHPSPPEYGS